MADKAIKVAVSSIKRAALEHGVPRTTLYDRHTSRMSVIQSCPWYSMGLILVHSHTWIRLKKLCDFVVVVGQIGYGKTQRQIRNIAEAVAHDKGILKKEKISDGWLWRFLERQPSLSLQKGDSTATACMEAMADRGAIENYFKLLRLYRDKRFPLINCTYSNTGFYIGYLNPLNPKFVSLQTTFSPHMPFMHLISISVQALTPKPNPCLLLALISSLVTLTTPTH